MTGEILFYSNFPFGFHNIEAEEKMARFAARGYRVHYVEQLGIRNPRPTHVLEVARRLRRGRGPRPDVPFDVIAPKLLAPRRMPVIDAVNRRWLARQLLSRVENPASTVLWLRYPTPELVPIVEDVGWRAVVYEVVDDDELTPGMTDRLRRIFRDAEARVLARADLVFAWSEPIRDRLAARHANVKLASAAVDVDLFARAADSVAPAPRLAVYAGNLDERFDAELVAGAAARLPDWRFLLAGPADADATGRLAGVENLELAGRLPHREIPRLIAGGSVGLMPYRRGTFAETAFPIKLVEYLAAGLPVVSSAILAAERLADEIRLGEAPESFAAAIEAAAESDSPEARQRRMALAWPYSWDRRIDEMEAAIDEVARRP